MRLLVLLLVAALATPAYAASGSVGGFGEVRFSGSAGVDGRWWQVVERFRPRFQGDLHPRVSLFAEIEMGFAQGRNQQLELQRTIDESDFGPLLERSGFEWPSKKNHLLQIDDAGGYLDVARLYVDFYLPFMDLRIGRQALFWGSAQMLNPTDPFPELLVAEPWRPRRGTNAIRATIPIGPDADFTAVVATSDVFDAFRAAGRLRTRLGPTDLAFVAAYRGDDEDGLFGFDLRGTFGVGWWVEGAMHVDGDGVTHEVAVGVDYSFPVLDGLIVMAQYYTNGRGGQAAPASGLTASPELAAAFGVSVPEPKTFAPLLSGKHYLVLSVSEAFAPEVSLSVFALQNLSDGTGFVVPTLSVSPLGWLSLSLSAQIPYRMWGDGGEFKPDPDDLVITADAGPLGTLEADLSGLVSVATVTFWARASF